MYVLILQLQNIYIATENKLLIHLLKPRVWKLTRLLLEQLGHILDEIFKVEYKSYVPSIEFEFESVFKKWSEKKN